MRKKCLVYLSGPYSGEIEKNIAAAREVAIKLWEAGYWVICPHLNTAHFEVDCKVGYQDYIDGDCRMIDGCDALVMLPNWAESRGAVIEKDHATGRGIPSYVWPSVPPLEVTPENVLQEANRLVHGNRGADYGHPLDDFSRTAQMWSAIMGRQVTANQVGLCMVAVKLSRECNKPKRDNLVDVAGYAETVQMLKEEAVRRAFVDDK